MGGRLWNVSEERVINAGVPLASPVNRKSLDFPV